MPRVAPHAGVVRIGLQQMFSIPGVWVMAGQAFQATQFIQNEVGLHFITWLNFVLVPMVLQLALVARQAYLPR